MNTTTNKQLKSDEHYAPEMYQHLRNIARNQLRKHQRSTINTTMLVHEAYLKYNKNPLLDIEESHFLALSARIMRQILVDYARERNAKKRGRDLLINTYDDNDRVEVNSEQLLDIDQALNKLATWDSKLVSIVELRFFAGLSLSDAAKCMGVSPRTAARFWSKAKVFLELQLAS